MNGNPIFNRLPAAGGGEMGDAQTQAAVKSVRLISIFLNLTFTSKVLETEADGREEAEEK